MITKKITVKKILRCRGFAGNFYFLFFSFFLKGLYFFERKRVRESMSGAGDRERQVPRWAGSLMRVGPGTPGTWPESRADASLTEPPAPLISAVLLTTFQTLISFIIFYTFTHLFISVCVYGFVDSVRCQDTESVHPHEGALSCCPFVSCPLALSPVHHWFVLNLCILVFARMLHKCLVMSRMSPTCNLLRLCICFKYCDMILTFPSNQGLANFCEGPDDNTYFRLWGPL